MKTHRSAALNVLSTLVIVAGVVLASRPAPAGAQDPAMPDGWHDGSEGTVGAESCSAFGWAVDPDDRYRDVQIQVLADGSPVAETTASLPREGVAACPDGTCGFVVRLWGLISPEVEHLITARALDAETQTWIELPGTPKTVTCVGFPEGVHDGPEGLVNSGSCGAFGWAVDPDDRDRDLQVRILADGAPAATVTANLAREGLTACPGGTCGFAVDLWGLVSSAIEHQITAQAYDQEAGIWVDLWGTPKALTCMGFPEGVHDGAEGVVDQYSCNANGWAVDPDDRARDVDVRILSDGNEVATVLADVYREDLYTLGICPGGTCSWFTDLWGLISHDVEHLIMAQVFDQETSAWLDLASTPKPLTCTTPPPPAPIITVSTSNNYLRADHFAPNTTVTFTVYPSALGGEPAIWADSRTTDDSGFAIIWPWEGPPDVVVGNYVVATGGTETKDLVLEDVTINVFDPATDIVAGTASPGEYVYVVVGNEDVGYPAAMPVYADADGNWTADFAGTFDIPWDMWGSAHVFDEDGDVTVFHLGATPPPSPWLTAFPEWEFVEGFEWPLGATVHLTIDDPATEGTDVEMADVAEPTPWGDPRHYVSFDLPDGYDLKPGDIVTLTDGVTPRTMVVRFLTVSAVDEVEDSVSGTADPGAIVNVWPHETGEQLAVTTGDDGRWQVDLTGAYDIVPGSAGRAEIRDEFSNGTAVDWYVPIPPSPWLLAFAEYETVQGWEWPMNVAVHLEIDDPNTEASPDYEADSMTAPTPWGDPRSFVEFAFGDVYDLKAGDIVRLTDGTTPRIHVVRALSVTEFDVETDTIAGFADAGATVHLWPHEFDQTATVQVTADDRGAWLADFSGLFDLVAGTGGRAQAPDETGNATAVDWTVPNPWFTAFPEGEIIEGWDWPLGASMRMAIDDSNTEISPDFVKDGVVIPAPWGSGQRWLWIEFPGEYDLKAGDIVTVTDGVTPRTHVVEILSITSVDADANVVAGMASPGRTVILWSWEDPEGRRIETTADSSGAWAVDFDDIGLDLAPGQHVRAEVWDEGGNDTAVDRDVPMPIQIDIRPWSDRNLVACRATWDLLPVAVLSATGMDATAIDHNSVRFGKTGTEAEVIVMWGRPLRYQRDVNGDGMMDMVYTFRFGDTGFSCADIPAGQQVAEVESLLTGWMSGVLLEGSDTLRLFALLGQ